MWLILPGCQVEPVSQNSRNRKKNASVQHDKVGHNLESCAISPDNPLFRKVGAQRIIRRSRKGICLLFSGCFGLRLIVAKAVHQMLCVPIIECRIQLTCPLKKKNQMFSWCAFQCSANLLCHAKKTLWKFFLRSPRSIIVGELFSFWPLIACFGTKKKLFFLSVLLDQYQRYNARVNDVYVMEGNTAVLECVINPHYMRRFVTVTRWTRNNDVIESGQTYTLFSLLVCLFSSDVWHLKILNLISPPFLPLPKNFKTGIGKCARFGMFQFPRDHFVSWMFSLNLVTKVVSQMISLIPGDRFSVMQNGILHVWDATPSDGFAALRCVTNNTLTGEERTSNIATIHVLGKNQNSPEIRNCASGSAWLGREDWFHMDLLPRGTLVGEKCPSCGSFCGINPLSTPDHAVTSVSETSEDKKGSGCYSGISWKLPCYVWFSEKERQIINCCSNMSLLFSSKTPLIWCIPLIHFQIQWTQHRLWRLVPTLFLRHLDPKWSFPVWRLGIRKSLMPGPKITFWCLWMSRYWWIWIFVDFEIEVLGNRKTRLEPNHKLTGSKFALFGRTFPSRVVTWWLRMFGRQMLVNTCAQWTTRMENSRRKSVLEWQVQRTSWLFCCWKNPPRFQKQWTHS